MHRVGCLSTTVLVVVLLLGSPLLAADEISRAMKQILDHRADDFVSIRKDPQDAYGETDYKSSVVVPAAKECYIRQEMKPHYAESCDVAESKNRALVTSKYAKYVKELRAVAPASWISWTEERTKPSGERIYLGPDRSHPAAMVGWVVEGMNANFFLLTVTVYAQGSVKQ
ncbi:MAG: hypothetical protein ABSA57_00725 [Candidatus Acidiferrales bacterium]|jgi:hypothetical protein